MFAALEAQRFDGMVGKRADSLYVPGRSKEWLKVKTRFGTDQMSKNAVDAVENVVYHRALDGDIIAAIFYLKAQRPRFRDRLNINVEQVQSEIDEMIERFRENPGLLNPVSRMMLNE